MGLHRQANMAWDSFQISNCVFAYLTHSEQRPQNICSQEEINLYCIIKLATWISLFSLQISETLFCVDKN